MRSGSETDTDRQFAPWWPAAVIWLVGWPLLLMLDERLHLVNEAVLLVLFAAVGSIWLRPLASIGACAVAILAFNFIFVPPRGTLDVDLREHALLLVTMLAVSSIVTLLMARQRRFAQDEQRHAARAEQLRTLGERLREIDDPLQLAEHLQDTLQRVTGSSVVLLLLRDGNAQDAEWFGDAVTDEQAGLRICARDNVAMGPGSGRHEEQRGWYLPMRGRRASMGAALLRLHDSEPGSATTREHAQALCDQMGLALERAAALAAAAAAREAAQTQELRSTLLASIAHDHRTPLATILGAASSLHDQDDRLLPEQRRRLAATIVDEAEQLVRLTDNTLELARLDSPGVNLDLDWESAEEIVGTVMRRLRQRHGTPAVSARVEPALPLFRCDAVLVVQLLDNLVDNALRYGGDHPAVEIVARTVGPYMLFAVQDRGRGVPVAARERIFEVFQRGDPVLRDADESTPRGAGVGLAVCRAIARVHGGELTYRPRNSGGAAFELRLPLPVTRATPPPPEASGP